MKKIYYIAELNLPNPSAYSIHVVKMCEAIKKTGANVCLLTINGDNRSLISNFYNIKEKFKIISIFKKKINLNFFFRIFFTLNILIKTNSANCIYISRSVVFALIASLLRKKVILELHHEISGFSKTLYFFLKYTYQLKNLNYIFTSKKLNNIYKIEKNNNIVLDSAVNIEDFKIKKKFKRFKNTCVYIGSFFQGKGIEQIVRLANLDEKMKFHLYGEKKFLKFQINNKNIKIFNHKSYKKVPNILSSYDVALMPYQKIVKGRSSIAIQKYMSPMKMFDYMAAGAVIVASDLKVYKHILKNNFNSKLIQLNNDNEWIKTINKLFTYKNKNKFLKKNAYKTAKKYTWDNRVRKIFNKFKIEVN